MAKLLFSLLILFSLESFCFEYEIDQKSFIQPSLLGLAKIRAQIEGHSLRLLTKAYSSNSFLKTDEIFVSSDWSKSILIKSGLKVSPRILGQIIREDSMNLAVIHFEISGISYLAVSKNINSDELRAIFSPWIPSKSYSLFSLFVKPVWAQETCNNGTKDVFTGLKKSTLFIENNEMLHQIGTCGADALSGIKESSTHTFEFFKNLASHPDKIWAEMQQDFEELKNLSLNVKEELNNAIAQFSALSSEQKRQIACFVTGSTIESALEAGVLKGGLAGLLPQMIAKLKKTSEILKELNLARQRGFKVPESSSLTQEILSCVQ